MKLPMLCNFGQVSFTYISIFIICFTDCPSTVLVLHGPTVLDAVSMQIWIRFLHLKSIPPIKRKSWQHFVQSFFVWFRVIMLYVHSATSSSSTSIKKLNRTFWAELRQRLQTAMANSFLFWKAHYLKQKCIKWIFHKMNMTPNLTQRNSQVRRCNKITGIDIKTMMMIRKDGPICFLLAILWKHRLCTMHISHFTQAVNS